MKKNDNNSKEIRSEYKREDFGQMVRGKYVKEAKEPSNFVVLDPDVAEAFPTAEIVNETLRRLIEIAKSNVHVKKHE